MQKVLDEVKTERARQDSKWGGPDHDDAHTHQEFLGFIEKQKNLALQPDDPQQPRTRLIKIAALAIAAVESLDRKNA